MPGFVKIIADSQNPEGVRLTTFEASAHLFNWVDWLTHRDFSRNAQSNRAIPTKKIIENVRNDLAWPYWWGQNQPGMAADEQMPPEQMEKAKAKWKEMSLRACEDAEYLLELGCHKQVLNRCLAPYMWIRAVISSTKWDNFFTLRCHKAAQPEIRIPAEWMREALDKSTPKQLQWGEWHIPFLGAAEKMETNIQLKVSTSRIARVSYISHSGDHTVEKDMELYNRLFSEGHYSPFEHCAMADEQKRSRSNFDSSWLQYRKVVESNNPYFVL